MLILTPANFTLTPNTKSLKVDWRRLMAAVASTCWLTILCLMSDRQLIMQCTTECHSSQPQSSLNTVCRSSEVNGKTSLFSENAGEREREKVTDHSRRIDSHLVLSTFHKKHQT